jgi:myo-inositol-1(or 4)-monophosphatase
MAWEKELDLAKRAARDAGARLRVAIADKQTVLMEDVKDIKLQADRDAEARILDMLRESPYPVLAEDSGEHGALAGDEPFWVVDPLDGTLNFSRGLPICCVSIALSVGDAPFLGVIYDFNRDELFSGVVGEGAWLNDAPMRVSDISEAMRGTLSGGFPVGFDYDEAGMASFLAILRRFRKLRLLGSAALSLAYVASGRIDAYFEDDIMYWDIAAGVALVKAAGGHAYMKPSCAKWSRWVRCASRVELWRA